jgi:hypothetical protein
MTLFVIFIKTSYKHTFYVSLQYIKSKCDFAIVYFHNYSFKIFHCILFSCLFLTNIYRYILITTKHIISRGSNVTSSNLEMLSFLSVYFVQISKFKRRNKTHQCENDDTTEIKYAEI